MVYSRIAAAALAACSALLVAATDDAPRPASLEAQVLAQINEARQNPRAYAAVRRAFRRFFDGDILYLPGDPNGVITREGASAVDEAIDFLEHQRPLPPLDRGALLALAAQDHVDDQGAMGSTGHKSRDGAGPGQRVQRRGGDIYVSETISYGHAQADAVVRQLIVDDGVPGRGHRVLLFKDDYRFAGVGCGDHIRYGYMCVVDLSATVNGKPDLTQWAQAAPARAPVRARAR